MESRPPSNLGPGPEFDFIRRIVRTGEGSHPLVRVGPGDDCAIIGEFAISTDACVENVHFRRAWLTADEIGRRAAGAALSDLAAVAAEPVAILATMVFPSDDREFAELIMRGATAGANAVGATLIGGDVAAGELLVIDIVVIGRVDAPVLRSGARPGDEVWVTGRLGGAAAAVRALLTEQPVNAHARRRYAHPHPQVAAARWLRERVGLTAMIDLSDGLYGDVAHLAAASGCRIEVDTETIPLDTDSGATFEDATSGGEDYELCFTAPPGEAARVRAAFEAEFLQPITRVGMVTSGAGVYARSTDGAMQPVERGGYQHFKDGGR